MQQDYNAAALAMSGLLHLWPLTEASGSTFADLVPSGAINGTWNGTTCAGGATGPDGHTKAAKNDGTSSRYGVSNSTLDLSGSSKWTFLAWVRVDAYTDGDKMAFELQNSAGNGPYIQYEPDGGTWLGTTPKKGFAAAYDGVNGVAAAGIVDDRLPTATWKMVMFTVDFTQANNSEVAMHHDKATAGAQYGSNGNQNNSATLGTALKIGILNRWFGTHALALNGAMCGMAIFNRVLTTTERDTLYDAMLAPAAGTDTISFTDNTAVSWDRAHAHGRYIANALSWTDTSTTPSGVPAARTAIGSEVAIFTGTGTAGTFGAHYAFGMTVVLPDGKTLLAVARKASAHVSYDGILVGKLSTDDGGSWGSEFTIIDETAGGWDWRDPYITVLASGRLALTGGRRKQSGGLDYSQAPYLYTDDSTGQTGWTAPVLLSDSATGCFAGTLGSAAGGSYGSDIIEKSSVLYLFGYGVTSSSFTSRWDLWCAKSTDAGATWTFVSKPATWANYSFNAVEPQVELIAGVFYLTFHTEDGLPTDFYRTRSSDDCATWGTRVLVKAGETANRQGLTALVNGNVIISVGQWASGGLANYFGYYESGNGATFATTPTTIAAYPVGGASLGNLLWCMVTALSGTGDSQNVGFTYGAENGTQNKASVFYRQFTGTNGASVYRRAGNDQLAFTDTAPRPLVVPTRTGTDQLAWTDTATRSALSFTRSGTDSLTWGDTAARGASSRSSSGTDTLTLSDTGTRTSVTRSRTGTDTLTLSDTGTRTSVTRPRTGTDTLTLSDAATRTAVTYTRPSYIMAETFGHFVVPGATGRDGNLNMTTTGHILLNDTSAPMVERAPAP